MNFANMLTTIRIVIVPLFVALLKVNNSQICRITTYKNKYLKNSNLFVKKLT